MDEDGNFKIFTVHALYNKCEHIKVALRFVTKKQYLNSFMQSGNDNKFIAINNINCGTCTFGQQAEGFNKFWREHLIDIT